MSKQPGIGLLVVGSSTNLGDYITSIAVRNLLPKVDFILNSDKAQVTTEVGHVFFTSCSEVAFPPSDKIIPHFVSFELTDPNLLADSNCVTYLQKYQPIGCKDLRTLHQLEKAGVKAQLTGPILTTLKSNKKERGNKVIIVDTPIPAEYKDEDIEVLSHLLPLKKAVEFNYEKKLEMAQNLIDKYATAKLVITSKIECYLACLALGTFALWVPPGGSDEKFESKLDSSWREDSIQEIMGSDSLRLEIAKRLETLFEEEIKTFYTPPLVVESPVVASPPIELEKKTSDPAELEARNQFLYQNNSSEYKEYLEKNSKLKSVEWVCNSLNEQFAVLKLAKESLNQDVKITYSLDFPLNKKGEIRLGVGNFDCFDLIKITCFKDEDIEEVNLYKEIIAFKEISGEMKEVTEELLLSSSQKKSKFSFFPSPVLMGCNYVIRVKYSESYSIENNSVTVFGFRSSIIFQPKT